MFKKSLMLMGALGFTSMFRFVRQHVTFARSIKRNQAKTPLKFFWKHWTLSF